MVDLLMSIWRPLLQQTTTLFDAGEIAAIDETSFDRVAGVAGMPVGLTTAFWL